VDKIAELILIATVVEGLVEYIGADLAGLLKKTAALALGIVFAFATGIALIPTPNIPWLGLVFTGVVIGRGANYVHDLLGQGG